MKLIVNKELKNNTYRVELQVLDITDTDREKISDFGEPTIDVGGVVLIDGVEKEYVVVQEPVTEEKTQTVMVDVLDEEGNQTFDDNDVVIQEAKEETVVVPVLDENGKPKLQDKLDEEGEKVYQLVDKPVQVVLADLGKQLRNFPSDFPVSRTFAVSEFGSNTELVANEYVKIVKNALTEAIEQLESKKDEFSGREEIQL